MIDEGDLGSVPWVARRGRNCWIVRTGETRRVLIVSTRSEGGRKARVPSG